MKDKIKQIGNPNWKELCKENITLRAQKRFKKIGFYGFWPLNLEITQKIEISYS